MANAQLDPKVMDFINSFKKNKFIMSGLYKSTWTSGEDTEVYTVTVYPQGEIILQWNRNRPCKKFIQSMVEKHPDLLQDGYFSKSDSSCPSYICFKVKGSPLMERDNQLRYMDVPGGYFDQ